MDQQSTRTDIAVDVDGFWMLQALLDIRHVARELRCAGTERRSAGIKINHDQQISPVHGIAGSGAARVGFVRCSVLPQLLFLAATADPRPAR